MSYSYREEEEKDKANEIRRLQAFLSYAIEGLGEDSSLDGTLKVDVSGAGSMRFLLTRQSLRALFEVCTTEENAKPSFGKRFAALEKEKLDLEEALRTQKYTLEQAERGTKNVEYERGVLRSANERQASDITKLKNEQSTLFAGLEKAAAALKQAQELHALEVKNADTYRSQLKNAEAELAEFRSRVDGGTGP